MAIDEGCRRSFLVDVWGSGKFGGSVFPSIFFLDSAFLLCNASNRRQRASSMAQCQDESKY